MNSTCSSLVYSTFMGGSANDWGNGIKICNKCGKPNYLSDKFCGACGTQIILADKFGKYIARCTECDSLINDEAKYCTVCGKKI